MFGIYILYIKTHLIGILYVISHGWGGGNGNDFGKDRLFLERKPVRLAHRSPAI